MNPNLKTVKDFKERVKEYEQSGSNATTLKQLTVKDRLALLEMVNMFLNEKLEKHIRAIWLCLILLASYVVTDCIIDLWR